MEAGRALTENDLPRLADVPRVGSPILRRLTATHHKQALLLAEGKTIGQVAAIVGCTPTRIMQLQSDPAFSELVHYYQDQIISAMLSDTARLKDKLVDVGEMAVDELRERLEDENIRKKVSIGEIRKIAEFAMDRTVAPPVALNAAPAAPQAVTINFGTGLRSNPGVSDSKIVDQNGNQIDIEHGNNS